MNSDLAMKVANAVLYEGYMLYPYRASAIKNRQRWSFGILYPPNYKEVSEGTERAQMHSECLVRPAGSAKLHIQVRFLVLLGDLAEECIERTFAYELPLLTDVEQTFSFTCANAAVSADQPEIAGKVSVRATKLAASAIKLAIDINNTSSLNGDPSDRDSALRSSLLSAHMILTANNGEFVSLLDPPEELRQAVSECKNVGNFPVLVGEAGERDMMLCSPIVLYDYPQIAPESAGDFFDGTEMDEMLTLRILTLTDDEKSAMLSGDDRVRDLLRRTEETARQQLRRTHGTIRNMRPVNE